MSRTSRRHKHWLKAAGVALAVVVGYDLYKANTGLPAPTTNAQRLK